MTNHTAETVSELRSVLALATYLQRRGAHPQLKGAWVALFPLFNERRTSLLADYRQHCFELAHTADQAGLEDDPDPEWSDHWPALCICIHDPHHPLWDLSADILRGVSPALAQLETLAAQLAEELGIE